MMDYSPGIPSRTGSAAVLRLRPWWQALALGAGMLLAFGAGSVHSAVVLGEWNFNNSNHLPSTPPANVNAGSFVLGSGIDGTTAFQPTTTVAGIDGTVTQVFGAGNLLTSASQALAANDYFSFTLAPETGSTLSFSELSFYGWANSTFPATGTDGVTPVSYTYFLTSSVTGDLILGSGSSTARRNNTPEPTGLVPFTFDLSDIEALQGVDGEVEFFLGVYLSEDVSSGNLRVDSVQMSGTVSAIPEPSRGLLGLIAVGMLLLRRRGV